MEFSPLWSEVLALAPAVLMAVIPLATRLTFLSTPALWKCFQFGSAGSVAFIATSLMLGSASSFGLALALLVQLLGTVIAGFSARYLEGEAGQRRYIGALGAVLASVQLLLISDHWLVLIAAWACVGFAMQQLLCFYPERPFALLAAHKKRIADRLADLLLVGAAGLAWLEVGSGSFTALQAHIAQHGMSASLHTSAILLVLAVTLRTALLPVHGWLIQVMEAPTPVSALLHAGVINLGGFVLIRFAPLLEQASAARTLLMLFGLATAILAGMVMLTRVSVKVRLAWSTVAQMGFLMLECALGLYTLAALHLIGHSLYKAHAFLSASSVVRDTRLQALYGAWTPSTTSVALAPVLTITTVILISTLSGMASWPWWWSVALGLAWAPLLWLPPLRAKRSAFAAQLAFGLAAVAGLTGAAIAAHAIPFALKDAPDHALGLFALAGLALLYLCQGLVLLRPEVLSRWRRWSYAGFYLDEAFTRLALTIWHTRWTPKHVIRRPAAALHMLADTAR